jgi:hypothetical protein
MVVHLAQHRPIEPGAAPSADEAAAIVAAIEQFMRATAPAFAPASSQPLDPWRTAAIVEGVTRDVADGSPVHPWMRTS